MEELKWIKEVAEEIRRQRRKEPEEGLIRRADAGEVVALKKVINAAVRDGAHEKASRWMQKFYEIFERKMNEGDGIGTFEMVCHNGPREADYRGNREEAMWRQVVELLEKQLQGGNEEVRWRLDRCYYKEIIAGKRNVEDVIRLWEELAESGNAKAEWCLSGVYASLTDNEVAAREWLERSAQHGYAAAQYAMAEYYITVDEETDEYVGKEAEKAITWLERAAEQRDEPMGKSAMLWLGDIYKFGCKQGNICVDYPKAIGWYRLAAQYGNCYDRKEALIKLADCYRKDGDESKSERMFELLAKERLLDEND